MIKLHIAFDVKQSLKWKARIVAHGDMTDLPCEAVYFGVASLRSPCVVCLFAELNGLKLTGGDVRNTYLEAHTSEKVCVCAGPEFGPLEGHLFVIKKALCKLHTFGARFHAKFADALRAMGFVPTYADTNVWIRDAGNCCEYVVVYVDDTLTALKDPDSFCKEFQSNPWNHKLKNFEELKYHLVVISSKIRMVCFVLVLKPT